MPAAGGARDCWCLACYQNITHPNSDKYRGYVYSLLLFSIGEKTLHLGSSLALWGGTVAIPTGSAFRSGRCVLTGAEGFIRSQLSRPGLVWRVLRVNIFVNISVRSASVIVAVWNSSNVCMNKTKIDSFRKKLEMKNYSMKRTFLKSYIWSIPREMCQLKYIFLIFHFQFCLTLQLFPLTNDAILP